jgi:hypothetical protein
VEVRTYARAAWLFRRLLGVVYLCAFLSLDAQLPGLLGSHGVLPAGEYMESMREAAAAEGLGLSRFYVVPTLFWISASDISLRVVCWAGVAAGVLLAAGLMPLAAMAVAWVAYVSLSVVGQDFLAYQWDALLLESGFLALLIAPVTWRDALRGARDPSRPAVWLMQWLLFRLMVASGSVKLSSGDPTWASLTALQVHFETQPLPTPAAWYFHHLPSRALTIMCGAVIATELLAPLLLFGGRRARIAGFGLLVGLQGMIALTGNYAWFNLLSAGLCLFLLDDRMLRHAAARVAGGLRAALPAIIVAVLTVPVTLSAFLWSFGIEPVGGAVVAPMARILAPYRVANRYGLFAVMTTSRPEIIVEGSENGTEWTAYDFKYKPDDPNRRPRWAAPHQPRLDWHLWFTALGGDDTDPPFRRFTDRLLDASPPVLDLLARDPFGGRPPRFVRARLERYRFSRTGTAWWVTEPLGDFMPARSRK